MRFRVSTSYCRRWDHLSPGRRAVRKYYNTGRKKINQFFQTGIDLGKAAIIGVSPKRKINTYPPLFNRLRYEVRTGAGFFSLLNQWFKTTRLISCMIEADEKNLEGQAGDGMVKISKEETGKRIRRLLAESGITVRDVQEELSLLWIISWSWDVCWICLWSSFWSWRGRRMRRSYRGGKGGSKNARIFCAPMSSGPTGTWNGSR